MGELAPSQAPHGGPQRLDASAALQELVAGNRRFVAGKPRYGHWSGHARSTAAGQRPHALVLTCLDSRVPPEAIFDQDFGGVCVVRTGGHVLDRAALGSIEFAVDELAVPLVMVLGHTRCGAVGAAMAAVREGSHPGGALGYLVEQIRPAVQEAGLDGADPYGRAVDRHVRRTVDQLINGDHALARTCRDGRLTVVGAVYDLDTGSVASMPS